MATTSDSAAFEDVLAERERQIAEEGWTSEHDDQHVRGELALAAACYAVHSARHGDAASLGGRYATRAAPPSWPWDLRWWKPKDPRRDLVRAAALIVAEIERLDRRPAMADSTGVSGVRESLHRAESALMYADMCVSGPVVRGQHLRTAWNAARTAVYVLEKMLQEST